MAATDNVPTGGLAAPSTLTDDERVLRALALNLLREPRGPDHGGAPWLAGEGAQAVGGPHDAAHYATALLQGNYSSASARYARLLDDTRNDIVRLDPFFAAARRVVDLDRKRERSLAYIPSLTPQAVADAHRRVRDNRALIFEVHRAVVARTAMYRYALERLVVMLPSPMAVEAERARIDLERHLVEFAAFVGTDVGAGLAGENLASGGPVPRRRTPAKP